MWFDCLFPSRKIRREPTTLEEQETRVDIKMDLANLPMELQARILRHCTFKTFCFLRRINNRMHEISKMKRLRHSGVEHLHLYYGKPDIGFDSINKRHSIHSLNQLELRCSFKSQTWMLDWPDGYRISLNAIDMANEPRKIVKNILKTIRSTPFLVHEIKHLTISAAHIEDDFFEEITEAGISVADIKHLRFRQCIFGMNNLDFMKRIMQFEFVRLHQCHIPSGLSRRPYYFGRFFNFGNLPRGTTPENAVVLADTRRWGDSFVGNTNLFEFLKSILKLDTCRSWELGSINSSRFRYETLYQTSFNELRRKFNCRVDIVNGCSTETTTAHNIKICRTGHSETCCPVYFTLHHPMEAYQQ